jgi:hypothetical protein
MLTLALSPGTPFREHCAEDIEELCEQQADQIALAEGYGADSQVIGCLEVRSLAGFVRLRLGGSTDKRQGGLWGRAAMQQCISGRLLVSGAVLDARRQRVGRPFNRSKKQMVGQPGSTLVPTPAAQRRLYVPPCHPPGV